METTLPAVYPNTYTYTWQDITPAHLYDVPVNRSKHATCMCDGTLYLHGGKDGNIPLKDLWKYNLETETWQKINVRGDIPPFLQEHSMHSYKKKLYIFGGAFAEAEETPLWMLNLDNHTWKKHKVEGEVVTPCGRRGHSAIVFQNALHIYGGFIDLKGSTSELWTFALESESWHLTWSESGSTDSPGARHGHSSVVHEGAMWVYGGMADLVTKGDLWKWSFGTRMWTRIRTRSGPPPLSQHIACKIPDGMFVFGGEYKGELQQDLWKFKFSCQTWQKILLHRKGVPSARVHHTAMMVPHFLLQSFTSELETQSKSEPVLKDVVPIGPRPHSSPPVTDNFSMDRSCHAFKNKISPMSEGPISYINPVMYSRSDLDKRNENNNKGMLTSDESLCKFYTRTVSDGDAITADSHMEWVASKTGSESRLTGAISLPSLSSQGSLDTLPLTNRNKMNTRRGSQSFPSLTGIDNPAFMQDTRGHFVHVRVAVTGNNKVAQQMSVDGDDLTCNKTSSQKQINRRRSQSFDILVDLTASDEELNSPKGKKSRLSSTPSIKRKPHFTSNSAEILNEESSVSSHTKAHSMPSVLHNPTSGSQPNLPDNFDLPGAVGMELPLKPNIMVNDSVICSPVHSGKTRRINTRDMRLDDIESVCSNESADIPLNPFMSCSPDGVSHEYHEMSLISGAASTHCDNNNYVSVKSNIEKEQVCLIDNNISFVENYYRNAAYEGVSRVDENVPNGKSDTQRNSYRDKLRKFLQTSPKTDNMELQRMEGVQSLNYNNDQVPYYKPEALYLYVIGGKEEGPQNLYRKPISMWKCQIHIGYDSKLGKKTGNTKR